VLLLFHGYGQNHTVFYEMAIHLGSRYTTYAFDLFFHGASRWDENTPLKKSVFKTVLEKFFQTESIEHFSVLGFSMGARFSLACIEAFPYRVKEVFLLAPDGIRLNPWYAVSVYPWPLRWFFKQVATKEHWFTNVLQFLEKRGWIDGMLARFASYQMGTPEKRLRVYQTWVTFRKLIFRQSKLARILNKQGITTTLIVGKHDPVIRPKDVEPFRTKLHQCHWQVLHAGHHDLIRLGISVISEHSRY